MVIRIWNSVTLGGLACNVRLEFAGNRIEREMYYGYGGGYTFSLSESERQLLYSACSSSNSLTVRYVVATIVNGVEAWWSFYDRTMTVVNSNPTFSNCTYKDVGSTSLQLTGDNQLLINGFNDLQVTISTGNKAVARNGATMSKYRLVCGNKSVEKSYNSSSDVVMSLGYVTNMTFVVYAIDSRGNSTAITKSVAEWKNYSPIAMKTGSATRDGGVGTETTLNFEGTIWNNNFGAVDNEIVKCQYRYKKSNESEYGDPIDIVPIRMEDSFSFSSKITGDLQAEGFNLTNSFNIQIIVADKINTTTYDILLGSGTPAMAIHRSGVAFGGPYDEEEGGSCQVDGKNIMKKNIITYGKNTNQSLTANTIVAIGLNDVLCKAGTKLTTQGHNIRIGEGVSKVLVSGIAWIEVYEAYKWFMIFKNEERVAQSIARKISNIPEAWGSVTIPPCLISVKEGDLIHLSILVTGDNGLCAAGNYGSSSTYLTVEVVE